MRFGGNCDILISGGDFVETIMTECRAREEKLIALRRRLHTVPEIGGELPKTKKIVCDFLSEIGVDYTENEGDDGIIAEIRGDREGKTIAFRADMDALHINEENDFSYRSQIEGQMHGCGHDAHTAILLIAAEILNKRRANLCGRVRLLFQTGEETGTGAKVMIENGALDGTDAVFALHVGNIAGDEHKSGDFIILPGPVSAGKNKFTIKIYGKGTHAAFPEKGIDPILVGAKIIAACEGITKRELPEGSAAVLNFGSFNAGKDHNTIPATAELRGGIRVQDEELRERLGEKLVALSEDIASAVGARCAVDIKRGSKTVMNDKDLSRMAADAVAKAVGTDRVKTETGSPLMGSDDFANYASRVPSVYFFLHTNNEQKGITETNHNPRFDVDEAVLWEGVAAYVAIAEQFLNDI